MMPKTIRTLVAACTAAAFALMAGCSTSEVAGGGTDMPNGTVMAGRIVTQDSTAVAGAPVTLRRIKVTALGDSIVSERRDTTDAGGSYRFSDVAEGGYIVYAADSLRALAAIDQFVTVASDTGLAISVPDMVFRTQVNLIGHILLPEGLNNAYADTRVFVPGTGRAALPDSQGQFRLSGLPRGAYDVGFVCSNIANFTHVDITADQPRDILLRDFEFAIMDAMADAEYRPYEDDMERSYYVSPKAYFGDQWPVWYSQVDTANVDYFRQDSTTNDLHHWRRDSLAALREYDDVVAGHLFPAGAQSDEAVLVTRAQDSLSLFGAPLVGMAKQGEFVVALVKVHVDTATAMVRFEVMHVEARLLAELGEGGVLKRGKEPVGDVREVALKKNR